MLFALQAEQAEDCTISICAMLPDTDSTFPVCLITSSIGSNNMRLQRYE